MHYAHAGVMASARILHLRPRTMRVLPIFVTSAQEKGRINRDFFRVSLCQVFFKSTQISLCNVC